MCVPTAGQDPIADTCGVFVSSSGGDDVAGDGSKAKPFKTLAFGIKSAAMANAPVYACSETFTETLTVAEGASVYGGLDCKKDWSFAVGAKSTLTAEADAVPLTVNQAASQVALWDFKVQAADAVMAGGSSIAVIVDHVMASFTRCDLIARNGVKGLDGTTPTDSVGPTGPNAQFDMAVRGNDGKAACPAMGSSQLGGEVKDNSFCPNANGGPLGGLGGAGGPTGGDGASAMATSQTALGGKGQPVADPMWGCLVGYGLANGGATGKSGLDGMGATGAAGLGQLTISGYAGVAGLPGDPGMPGQGGGGGGGAKGKVLCAGASGGGGGAGGCGGHGGTGGAAGGSSIGLVSLGATLAFDSVTIQLGTGGAGASGAFGQIGGTGGKGGSGGAGDSTAPATSLACDGGNGGTGGPGGQGGGGRGGHAIGIAATGKIAPNTKGVSFVQQGTVGLGGKGGPAQDGEMGVMADVQMFP
jgi:hypothetical protein